ncbi:RHS repeat domain-containing protein [Streptomyces sp. NPDC094034]|uniref:RHS repeat domain-containing protein n=1 Tax=Streptomyces sp. NPDC094034 TaxID=3155309 RepID=UPI00331C722D
MPAQIDVKARRAGGRRRPQPDECVQDLAPRGRARIQRGHERVGPAVSHIEYNDLHLPTRWTGPDGSQIDQQFDVRGNRTSLTGSDGSVVTHYTHHSTGAPPTMTGALGSVLTNDLFDLWC